MRLSRWMRAAAAALVLAAAVPALLVAWSRLPVSFDPSPAEFTVSPGMGLRGIALGVARAAPPLHAAPFYALARLEGRAQRLQAGTYAITSGMTPQEVLDKMERGDVVQIEFVIPDGWTFRQLRLALAADRNLLQTLPGMADGAVLAAIGASETSPEGIFWPDTYRFVRGTSDVDLLKRAYRLGQKRLADAWSERRADLPLRSPYEALILASIVEKETADPADLPLVAAVFVNRLRRGMLLQTDPTVIYGLGEKYDGSLHKRDLETDTPYNTYTRAGLPPTPIALPGAASLAATLHPPDSELLYFVSRGDGTSAFSGTLDDHNRAVNRYQKGGRS